LAGQPFVFPQPFPAVLYWQKNFATGMAALAAVLALSFLTFETIIKDETRNIGTITGYLTGYWLWVSAIILTFLLSLVNIFNTKETQK